MIVKEYIIQFLCKKTWYDHESFEDENEALERLNNIINDNSDVSNPIKFHLVYRETSIFESIIA